MTGSYDAWAPEATALARDGDGTSGTWSADVEGVKPGDEYRFRIRTADGDEVWRIDPYARQVTSSIGNAVVYDPSAFDWGDHCVRDAGPGRPRHLRAARRDVQRRAGSTRRLRPGRAAAAVPARPGRQRRADHAALRVRRRRLVGLQPGPPVRHRIRLRRARRVQALHQGGPRARHRGHRRRRLQPPGPDRPRPVAVRRLERERRRRDLLLQRRTGDHPVGLDPTRLRPRRGPHVPARQRADLARGVPVRRPALRRDAVHPHGGRGPRRPGLGAAGRLVVHGLDQRRDPGAPAVEADDRRGHPGRPEARRRRRPRAAPGSGPSGISASSGGSGRPSRRATTGSGRWRTWSRPSPARAAARR